MTAIDNQINQKLRQLLESLSEDEGIQRYKKLEEKIKQNEKLAQLEEEIKKAQQEAVQFAHYEKPMAEQAAIQRAAQLKEAFDSHPLVIAYREQLRESNDFLQYITEKIQYQFNERLEKEGS